MVFWSVISPAVDTPLYVAAGDSGLQRVSFTDDLPTGEWTRQDSHPVIRETARQLTRYFDGKLKDFDLPLDLRGTPFQIKVWNALLDIPYGKTISYAELAHRVQSPRGFRAVGAANGRNPIPIIVPCHRVIASDGTLHGYGGGLPYKHRLLQLEGAMPATMFAHA